MNPRFAQFRNRIVNPISFRFFMLYRLPAAFFAGLRVKQLDANKAVVSVRYKWFNQNPFRSMYFAIQSMAAEMSTGLLGFGQVYQRQPAVSMLVVKIEGNFHKKAIGTIQFTCEDGPLIDAAIEESILLGEGRTVTCSSTGTNEAGEIVASFHITWSFKAKNKN